MSRQLDAREPPHASPLPHADIEADTARNAAAAVTFIDSLESLH
jgi:hypothetical protein